MRAPFYREDTSPICVLYLIIYKYIYLYCDNYSLFPGKEGLKCIQRGTKQRLVRVITKVITAIHLKKQRDLNFKEKG